MKRLMFAIAMLAAACGGKKDDGAAGSGSAPATAPMAGSGSGSAAAGSGSAMAAGSGSAAEPVAEVDVPTEVDFEEDASAKITEKTLDTELKAIEAELE